MPRYNHAYDFGFEVISNTEDGSDVTPAQIRAALIKRATELPDSEIVLACGLFDTHEEEDAEQTPSPA